MSRSININITGNASSLIGAANQAKQAVSTVSVGFRSAVSDTSLATGAVDKFDKSLTKTGGTLNKIGNFMSNNRGLVFGAAGLASAIGEAVGMLGMYDDTVMRASEAQEELNKLQAQGVTSGHEYQQAQNEVTKANRFLNIVTRNTALSMMDNIFFATMLISSIQKMNINLTKLTGPFRAIIGLIKGVNTSTTVMTGALASFNVVSAVTPVRMVAISTTAGTIGPATIAASGGVATLTRTLVTFGRVAGVLTLVGAAVGTLAETVMVLNNTQDQRLEKGNSWFDNILKGDWDAAFKSLAKSMGVFKEDLAKQPLFGEWIAGISTMVENLFNLGPLFDDAAKGVKTVGDATKKSVDIYSTISGILDDTRSAMANAEVFTQSYIQTQASLGATTEESMHGIDAFADSLLEAGIRESVVDLVTQKLTEHFKDGNTQINLIKDSITGFGDAAREMTSDEALADFWLNYSKDVEGSNRVLQFAKDYVSDYFTTHKDKIEAGMKPQILFNQLIKNFDLATQELLKNEFEEWMENNSDKTKDFADNTSDAAQNLLRLNEEYEDLVESVSKHTDITDLNMRQMQAMDQLHEQNLGAIEAEALAVKDSIQYWNLRTEAQMVNAIADQQQIYNSIKLREILDGSNKSVIAQNNAWIAGRKAARDFFTELVLGKIETDEYRKGIEELAAAEGYAGLETVLLTNELEALVADGWKNNTDKAIEAARAISDFGDRARDSLSGLFDAEDNKEFGKAWKELDLGSIPDDLKDDFKKVFKEMRPLAEKGREVSTALDLIAASGDRISDNKLDRTLKEIVKDFGDFAKIDYEAMKLNELPGFLDFIGDSANKNSPLMIAFTDAMRDNNITADEYATIIAEAAKQGIILNDTVGTGTGKFGQFTDEVNASADSVITMTGFWEQLMTYMVSSTAIMVNHWKDKVNEMIRLSDDTKNDITKVFEEMGKKANSIFVKIANNFERAMKNIVHNAGVAASKVNSELAKIKDKTVTITYQTKGSPQATGGIYSSFAEGGLVSARSGYMNTVSQPTLFLYGDNTSRQETMAFIPHNQPYRDQVMDRLDSMFGRQKGNINIQAGGDDGRTIIINETIILGEERFHFQRKYRAKQGQEVASLVGV